MKGERVISISAVSDYPFSSGEWRVAGQALNLHGGEIMPTCLQHLT